MIKNALIFGTALILTVGLLSTTHGTQKTLASTMNIYVFPTKGQAADQQSQDEAACYQWATENTGNDPFDLAKQAEAEKAEAQAAQEQAKPYLGRDGGWPPGRTWSRRRSRSLSRPHRCR